MPAPWRFFQTNRRLRGQISVAFTVMGVHPALTCHISRSPQRLVLVPESHTGSAKISSESLLFSFSSIDSLSLGFGSFDTWDPSSRFFFCDLVIGHLHPTSLGGSSTGSFSLYPTGWKSQTLPPSIGIVTWRDSHVVKKRPGKRKRVDMKDAGLVFQVLEPRAEV